MKMYLILNRKNARFLNNRGFTMLEMLYAFSIFLLVISFFPICIKYLLDHEQLEAKTKRMEWYVFVNQLKKELRLAEEIVVTDDRLFLRKHGQDILFEKYGENLRRRVDYRGHEIVFQKVDAFKFSPLQNGVKLTLIDYYNQSYSASLYSYINLGKDDDPE